MDPKMRCYMSKAVHRAISPRSVSGASAESDYQKVITPLSIDLHLRVTPATVSAG